MSADALATTRFASSRDAESGALISAPVADAAARSKKAGKVFHFLFFAALVMSPFYLWKSGLPQLSDMLMALAVLSLGPRIFAFVTDQRQTRAFMWLCALTADVVVVSLIWFIIEPSDDFLLAPLFYVFSLMVFAMALGGHARFGESFARCVAYGTLTSVVLQTALSPFVVSGSGFRQELFFNNPNQLGYWSLLTGVLLALSYRSRVISKWSFFLGSVCCLWLVSLSLSKAAMVSFLVLGIMSAINSPRVMALVGMLLIVPVVAGSVVVDNVEKRMENIGEQSDDTFDGRGYTRMVDFPEYLILGAAEGGYDRMRLPKSQRHEIHSSIGTVLFSYGIVGTAVLGMFLFMVFRCGGPRVGSYMIPVMLYGLTHMGLREGLFWIALAQMCWQPATRST